MLNLSPSTTALVLIDLQKGLLGLPLAPHGAPQVLDTATRLAEKVAGTGGTVVLVRVDFGDGLAAAPRGLTDTPLAIPPGGIPEDWANIAPELLSVRPHLVVTKRHWSAFYGTDLDLQLRRRGITHMILGGLMTNFGVEFDRARWLAEQLYRGAGRGCVQQLQCRSARLRDRKYAATGVAGAPERRHYRGIGQARPGGIVASIFR